MAISDSDRLLNEHEVRIYFDVLEHSGYHPCQFQTVVKEDQNDVDMNDMSYVVIVEVTITFKETSVSKTYLSPLHSALWLKDFEYDVRRGYFETPLQQ